MRDGWPRAVWGGGVRLSVAPNHLYKGASGKNCLGARKSFFSKMTMRQISTVRNMDWGHQSTDTYNCMSSALWPDLGRLNLREVGIKSFYVVEMYSTKINIINLPLITFCCKSRSRSICLY